MCYCWLDIPSWLRMAPAEVTFSLTEYSSLHSLWCVLYLSLECGENVSQRALRRRDGVCFLCVCVYNWGGIVDGTDSPVWAVGGRWRLDVGGFRGVTITTSGVGRVSCHSVSADDSGDMRLRLRRNPQPSSRRQSCVPTLYLVTSEEVLKNKSIQMKVRFVSCVWSFSRPLLCQQMGMPCPRLLQPEQNFKWSSWKVQLYWYTVRMRHEW